jgi:hypothetical protein
MYYKKDQSKVYNNVTTIYEREREREGLEKKYMKERLYITLIRKQRISYILCKGRWIYIRI